MKIFLFSWRIKDGLKSSWRFYFNDLNPDPQHWLTLHIHTRSDLCPNTVQPTSFKIRIRILPKKTGSDQIGIRNPAWDGNPLEPIERRLPSGRYFFWNVIFSNIIHGAVLIRVEDPTFFSTDPDPDQLKKKSGSDSGSDLKSKWKKKYIYILGR